MRRTALVFSGFVVTCTLALAIPPVASASEGDAPHAAHVQRLVHRHGIPANADALSPAAPAARTFDNADGLSRNPGQCNTGCTDY